MVNLEVLSVNELSMELPIEWSYWGRGRPPETGYLRNYNPLWKNALLDNWIINAPRQRDEELAEDVGLDKPDESISWFDLLYDLFATGVLSIYNINHCGTGSKRGKGNYSISSRFVDPFLGSQNVEHAKKKAAYK